MENSIAIRQSTLTLRFDIDDTQRALVDQLTAQAILSMQESREADALESLKRAEEVLAAIPSEALPPTRRDEVDQRLWWGDAELGSRRLEAGGYEEALDPLIHALRFDSIGAERQAETRAAIVRTLEGIAALRAMSIRRIADAGCRAEAATAAEQLRALMQKCVELGVTESELDAVARSMAPAALSPAFHYERGDVLDAMGRYDEAYTAYRNANLAARASGGRG